MLGICPCRFAGFTAVRRRSNKRSGLHWSQRILHFGFIQTIGMCKNIRRCKGQQIRPQNDLWDWSIENRQQMGAVYSGNLIMPPALRHIRYLSRADGEMQQLIRERVDQ